MEKNTPDSRSAMLTPEEAARQRRELSPENVEAMKRLADQLKDQALAAILDEEASAS